MAGQPLPGEFDLIARHLAPLATAPAALGLKDDAAVLALEPGRELVVTTDALVAGVHFLPGDPPTLVARKALRVNLSDLAAMGARPLGYLLDFAFPPGMDEAWVAAFAAGLAADQETFAVALLGGDMTATPGPLTLAVTALGTVAAGRALLRRGARAGDLVAVSGTIGDAAAGLLALQGGLAALGEPERGFLIERYRLPQPRLRLGMALAEAGLANAAIDVSDGLVADLGHVSAASGLGAVVEAGRVPLSPAAAKACAAEEGLLAALLTGGDDYELLLALDPDRRAAAEALGRAAGAPLAVIGRFEAGEGVRVLDRTGAALALPRTGYRHC